MENKKIIVDGVDVSGCEFLIISKDKQMCRCIKSDLYGGIEFVENAKNGNCKDNPNCYYKQLKRKEQECETLASQLDFEVQKKECLEQECEELKETFDSLFKVQYKLADNNKKLRQCLTEIKEIAETCMELNDCTKYILQKISECEGKQ